MKFDQLLYRESTRMRHNTQGATILRILSPLSMLATARLHSEPTATTSIGTLLNLGEVDVHEVFDIPDSFNKRKPFIKKTLAKRHSVEGTMILYDVSSSYFEGGKCILSVFGRSKDIRSFTSNEVSPSGNPDRVIHVMSQATEIQQGRRPYWYGSKKMFSVTQ
ncbi:MAG: hypothetical protein OXC03_00935 [Flavobacteriaceae bacterium]|nr:hypothetical protein [Flavobacteriaceae bacterium]